VRAITDTLNELPDEELRRLKKGDLLEEDIALEALRISLTGSTLAHAARSLLTPKAYQTYVEPVIADMQQEYVDAVATGNPLRARWIALRVYLVIIPGWLYALIAGRLTKFMRRGQ
jgi:hypothetical protein